MTTHTRTLNQEEQAEFAAALDALRASVVADLGQADVDHMRDVIRASYVSAAAGRVLLHFGFGPISFLLGVASLATAKILENMEIGHNIMHGQYDWSGDPSLQGKTYEWDIVCDGDNWRHFHNYEHHTFTNVLGLDRDIGYETLRVAPEQPWEPHHLFQPISATVLALFFQWGVAIHDLRLEEYLRGERPWKEFRKNARPFARKAGWQLFKDYVFFPLIALGNAPRVFVGNLLANGIRNVWTFAIIFCGHFPDGVRVYSQDETTNESRGGWYLRQLAGSANLEGGKLFHLMTGHLSHQIEHHMFPDIPAARYPEMAPHVQKLCEQYGQPYNTGGFFRQFGSVIRRILRYALPNSMTSPGTQGTAQEHA
jgi:fatty acid desaturase